MPTEKRVPSLIVNTLTEAQYQALENPSDTEMWVTPYDESVLPDQTGNTGKFLTTDGSSASWATVNALPSQSGQSGKFLTTDGTDASWGNINALPLTGGEMHPATGQTEYSIDFEDDSNNTIGYISVDAPNGEIQLHNDGGKIDIRSYNGGEVEIAAADTGGKVFINGDDEVNIEVGNSGTANINLVNSGSGDIKLEAANGAIELKTVNDDNEQVIINGTILPILAANASMPSDTYDTLTLGASGATYIAPSDGYFVFIKNSTAAGQYVDMSITTGTTNNVYRLQTAAIANGVYCIQTVPAQKGSVLTVNYTLAGTGAANLFRFVYAEGSKSEKA